MAADPIHKKFQGLIESIQKGLFRSTHTAAGRPENAGIGERIIDKTFAEQLYGDKDAFMSRYKDFEEQYYKELSDIKNVRRSFAKGLDVDLMRNTGAIDLSILNLDSRKRLENSFAGKVLKIEELLSNAGLPSKHMPSSSPYRTPAMFEVDQGLEHPAQVMLNKTIFNIDPTSNSIADIKFGTTNIMSSKDLERNLFQIGKMKDRDAQGMSKLLDFTPNADGSAKKIITFDVETTGLGSGSQVRSISLAQRTNLDDMAQTVEKFGYNSPRLGGILAGPQLSDTLSGFLSRSEDMGTVVNSEEEFLENMKKVFTHLNNADQVTGHNVNFDITQSIRTMSAMKGYQSETELKTLVSTFLERKNQDLSFVVDTLELGRAYITDKAQKAIAAEPDSVIRGEEYIKKFFSTESLADVTTGGKATYAGVENFVMNTNLLDLMADEQHAPQIFEQIFKGSHIAETDTMLQDYILKYMHTGKLDFRDPSNVSAQAPAELLDVARKTVFKSAATTAVTNIADPQFLTDTAMKYAQGEGISGVRATISLQDILAGDLLEDSANKSLVQTQMNNNISQGFIKFDKGKFKLFTGAAQEGIDLERTKAEDHLRGLMADARNGLNLEEIDAYGQKFRYNAAEKRIMSLGITVEQNSAMGMMNRTLGLTEATEVNAEKYVDSVGDLYKNFADAPSKMHFRDIMRNNGSFEAKNNFSSGLNLGNFDEASEVSARLTTHAQASLAAGNKYGFLGVKETVISNILASGTSSLATQVHTKASLGGFEDLGAGLSAQITERFAYAANDQIADVTSQFGISHYKKQSSFRLAGEQGQAKKILLDYDYFKSLSISPPSSAVGAAAGAVPSAISVGEKIAEGNLAVSFSVAERKDQGKMFKTLNLVWKEGQDESGLTARSIAEQLHADFIETDNYKNKINSLDIDDLHTQAAMFKETYKEQPGLTVAENRERAIQSMITSIEERGVGIASFGENTAASQAVVESMTEAISKNGMDIANDTSSLQANILGEAGDTLALGHVYDKKVIDAGGDEARSRLRAANEGAMADASKVGKALSEDSNLLNRAITNLKSGRRQTPLSTAVENYHKFKGPVGIAALGLTALAGGYYMGKRKKETDLYNETLEQQPTESFRQNSSSNYGSSVPSLNSARRDPLVTAGVVGNLDNRKIGHTQMGNNKYNHLYGG